MSTSSTSNEADVDTRNKPPTKYLLLLDINGALCHRMTKRATNRESNDFRFKSYHVYRRPNFTSFVEYIDSVLSSSTMEVYFYTSIVQHNAEGMIKRLFPRPEHSHYQDRIFDRSYNVIRPTTLSEKGKSHNKNCSKKDVKQETMRDLNKVWKRLPEFDVTNTIIVDNSVDKCENCIENSIIVPTFVDSKTLAVQEDDTLIKLEHYLTQLVDDEPTDVRIYLRNHPFNSISYESLRNDTELESGRSADVSDVSKQKKSIQSEAKLINESTVSTKSEKDRKADVQSCLEEFEQLKFEGSST